MRLTVEGTAGAPGPGSTECLDWIGERELAFEQFESVIALAETKEVVGGYAVIEAADYDEAASVCRNHPAARAGRTMIRQVF